MPEPQKTAEPEQVIITPEKPVVPAPDADTESLKAELAKYQAREKITEVSKTYPAASEFADKIQELAKEKGYSIEDASIIVLQKQGKLQTAEQIERSRNTGDRSFGIGGSMDNAPPRDKKDPVPGAPGSAQFYAERFKELEAKGEIRVV